MEKRIYEIALKKLEEGGHFSINLLNKSLKVNGDYLIKDGKPVEDMVLLEPIDDIKAVLNQLYAVYKHSLPSKRRQKEWFKALKYEELEDQTFGEPRQLAQFNLEYVVLAATITGMMQPIIDEMGGGFFWKGRDSDFIILKSFIN